MGKVMQWLNEHGITEEIIKKRGIEIIEDDTHKEIIIPYFDDTGTIVNKKKFKKYDLFHFDNENFILYGNIGKQKRVYIVKDEFTQILLSEVYGYQNVVSLPFYYSFDKKDIQLYKSLLSQFEEFVFAFDKDEDGIKYQDILSEELGVDKCYYVDYTNNVVNLLSLNKINKEQVSICLEKIKKFNIPHLHTFSDYKEEIWDYYNNGSARGFSTGFSKLDEYFTLQLGSLNILTGIPSSGKSEFMDALLLNTIHLHKWKWVVYSPENMPITFSFQKLAEKLLRKPFFGDERQRIQPLELEKAIKFLSQNIFIILPYDKSLDIDDILLKTKVCISRYNINGLIIDPYNEIEHTRDLRMSETDYISKFLSKVRNFARIHNIIVFLVAHPTKMEKITYGELAGEYPVVTPYDIAGSAHFRNKADNCLSIWRRFNNNDDNLVELHIQKVRNKNIGKVGKVTFKWQRKDGTYTEVEHNTNLF